MQQLAAIFVENEFELRFLTALVVGGSPEGRRELNCRLGEQGIDCREAEDGIDALRFCSDLGIDVVITHDGANMSAVELMSLVKRGAFGPNPPPVIFWRSEGQDEAGPPPGFAGEIGGRVDAAGLARALAAVFPV